MFIYSITNTIDGKQYIGQTTKPVLQQRFNEHVHYLRNDTHPNNHLQYAWNKYGEDVFEFRVFKECDNLDELNVEEERLIKLNGDYNIEPGGDNKEISPETRKKISKIKRPRPYPKIADPDGNIHTIEPTLEEFCRVHSLTSPTLRAVCAGRIKYHKGWRLTTTTMSADEVRSRGQRREREYPIFISPDGKEHKIINFRKFCRDNKLNYRHMGCVRTGVYQQHKGWHIKGTTIIDPNVLRSNAVKGVNHPSAKLTPELVLEIRAQDLQLKDLAKKYNMPKSTIWNITHRKTWVHI